MENSVVQPLPLGKLSKREEEFLFYYVEKSALSIGGEIEIILGRLVNHGLIEKPKGPTVIAKDFERTLRGEAYVYSCLAMNIKPGVATNMFSNLELDYVRGRWRNIFRKACEELKEWERKPHPSHKENMKYHSNFGPPL